MAKNKLRHQDGMLRFNSISNGVNALFSLVFILLALITFLPAVFVLIISFSSEASVAQNGYSFFPSELSLSSYEYLWQSKAYIGRAFLNSVGLTVCGTLLGLVLISTMGYAISRPNYYLKKTYTWLIFIPMIFSGGLVATYMVNTQVYMLKNTYWALLLPGACSTFLHHYYAHLFSNHRSRQHYRVRKNRRRVTTAHFCTACAADFPAGNRNHWAVPHLQLLERLVWRHAVPG